MPRYRLASNNKAIGNVPLAERPVAIGRHPDNDISINDNVASRFHCVIEPDRSGRYVVRDLGSRNGTRLNGQRVSEMKLSEGDVITIGRHTFAFEVARVETATVDAAPLKPTKLAAIPAWASEVLDIVDSLPPKNAPLESITLIDASGKASETLANDAPGPMATRLLLQLASKARATDIHCEPKRDVVQIRMRIDGWMAAAPEGLRAPLIEHLMRVTQAELSGAGPDRPGAEGADPFRTGALLGGADPIDLPALGEPPEEDPVGEPETQLADLIC